MGWSQILQWAFVLSLVTAGVRLATPVLLAVLGEIITERSGVLNLGLEGIMTVGGMTGFACAYYLETGVLASRLAGWSSWMGLAAGMLGGMVMGLIMAVLTVTFRADQVITGITLVIFGVGLSDYMYRQAFSTLATQVTGMEPYPIPLLSRIPLLGDLLFNHNPAVYLTVALVVLVWVLLFRTTWGLRIRAAGEHPTAAETSGVNVGLVRYAATLLGSSLVGLGGAVITVAQLAIFREGIIAGKGWIAVALVIFARWRPGLALVGALLFGLADAIQFRVQALNQFERGSRTIPYEFLLMLPYVLTILALLYRGRVQRRSDQPAALGTAYAKGSQ